MIRLIVIKSPDKGSIIFRLMKPVFETKIYDYIRKNELIEFISKIDPDFILTDIYKPVNGNDLMSMVSELDEFPRLRVFYIDLFKFKKMVWLPSLHLKDRFFSYLFENKTAKKSH